MRPMLNPPTETPSAKTATTRNGGSIRTSATITTAAAAATTAPTAQIGRATESAPTRPAATVSEASRSRLRAIGAANRGDLRRRVAGVVATLTLGRRAGDR